jgi:hypothetical protein
MKSATKVRSDAADELQRQEMKPSGPDTSEAQSGGGHFANERGCHGSKEKKIH